MSSVGGSGNIVWREVASDMADHVSPDALAHDAVIVTRGNETQPASAPAHVDRPSVARGDRGDAVLDLQKMLNVWGNLKGRAIYNADGVFGRKTESQVLDFQRMNGLRADGKVGPQTWAKLEEKTAPHMNYPAPGRPTFTPHPNRPPARRVAARADCRSPSPTRSLRS